MKMLVKIFAILIIAVGSVVLVQRLIRKLYAGIGKKYILIEGLEGRITA